VINLNLKSQAIVYQTKTETQSFPSAMVNFAKIWLIIVMVNNIEGIQMKMIMIGEMGLKFAQSEESTEL
jgi:hypothetical protein